MANDRGSGEFEEIRILGLETPEDVVEPGQDEGRTMNSAPLDHDLSSSWCAPGYPRRG